jgi:tetratricopeptide (TPR) repeat protein
MLPKIIKPHLSISNTRSQFSLETPSETSKLPSANTSGNESKMSHNSKSSFSKSDVRSTSDKNAETTFSSINEDFTDDRINENINSFIGITNSYMLRKDKDGAVYTWNEVVEKITKTGNEKAIIGAIKIMAELYFEFKDIPKALECYHKVKYKCQLLLNTYESKRNDREKNLKTKIIAKEKMYAYKQMGVCFQMMKEYTKALVCFKLMLKLTWQLEDKEMELVCYDRMGMQHYYLGDMDRAAYYHDRMMRGKYESGNSDIRKIAMSTLKKRKEMGGHRSGLPKPTMVKPDPKSLPYSSSSA